MYFERNVRIFLLLKLFLLVDLLLFCLWYILFDGEGDVDLGCILGDVIDVGEVVMGFVFCEFIERDFFVCIWVCGVGVGLLFLCVDVNVIVYNYI